MFGSQRLKQWLVRSAIVVSVAGAAALLASGAASAATTPAAVSTTSTQLTSVDSQMLTLINQARTSRGLAALQAARGLNGVALGWSGSLDRGVTGYQLAHDPNAWNEVATTGAANRLTWGENVAWASANISANDLFTMYMNSPAHRANILSAAYHYVGLGTVSGAHGMWNTTEFTDAVQPGQVVSTVVLPVVRNAVVVRTPTVREGMFVQDSSTRLTYRITGGAPVAVTSWTPFGGPQSTTSLTSAQLAALPRFPANGTFVTDLGTGRVYRIAGGAPLPVTTWSTVGGAHATIGVDPTALLRAGGAGAFSHLAAVPVDNTYLQAAGKTYRVAAGIARYVSSWAQVGGVKPVTVIDPAVLAQAGTAGTHLLGVA